MAGEEFFALHEMLSEPVRRLLGLLRAGLLYFSWVIAGVTLIALLGCSTGVF